MLHSSSSRFSTGVPLSASAKPAFSPNAARATWLSGFLIACASSSTTVSQPLLGEPLGVEPQDRVGGQREVGGRGRARAPGRDRALRESAGRKRAASLCQLWSTLVGHTISVRPAHRAQRLQRLAEPHVVGQHGAEPRVAQEAQPVDARRAGSRAARRADPRADAAAGKPRKSRSSGASAAKLGGRGCSSSSHSAASCRGPPRGTRAARRRARRADRQCARRNAKASPSGSGAQPPPASGTSERPSCQARKHRFGARRSRSRGVSTRVAKLDRSASPSNATCGTSAVSRTSKPMPWLPIRVWKVAQARCETIGIDTVEVDAPPGDQIQLVPQPIDQAGARRLHRDRTRRLRGGRACPRRRELAADRRKRGAGARSACAPDCRARTSGVEPAVHVCAAAAVPTR